MDQSIIQQIKEVTGIIESIYLEQIELDEPFIDFASRFSHMPGTVILMSGGDLDCSQYHMVATRPWLSFTGRGQTMSLKAGKTDFSFRADPFSTLRMLLDLYQMDTRKLPTNMPGPVLSGLFGYLAYDLKDTLEQLPRTSVDDLHLPHICFFAPTIILIHDKKNDCTTLCIPERRVSNDSLLDQDLQAYQTICASNPSVNRPFSGGSDGLRSNFTKADYMETIRKIQDYIVSGHVYQVNMSQRFETDFQGDPYSLFKTLFAHNPAPFYAFIQAGDHQIVSTSPERFIQRSSSHVETRPIKGTRPRGNSDIDDKRLCNELMKSQKDDAELSMIVDLLRNDMGKVCVGGTVRVTEHKRLEAYQNVYHLISIVEGTLNNDFDSVDLIAATFPGGSITGCPKIRSMEIIDELEPNRRHIYTGSIGYISFHETMDLSIAIRTATTINDKILFSVGGGIVFDSDPEEEFDETLHKGRTLMEGLQKYTERSEDKAIAWINGTLKPLDQASIPITDLGVQYGYGFFETIRVDRGKPKFLEAHTKRFNRAAKQLFFLEPPDLSWDEIISDVIQQNELQDTIAAVKIMATKGDRDIPPFNNQFIVTARPYTHRLSGKEEPGLNLITYPEPRQTPLAAHKTLNYLYYFLAGKWASENSADEALILNPDHSISETNTGNLIVIQGGTATVPISTHVLPGTMQQPVLELLRDWGFDFQRKRLVVQDIFDSDLVLITNSLMGAVPALRLDTNELNTPPDWWRKINDKLF